MRIVILPEKKTGSSRQPMNMLVTLARCNYVGTSAKLTLKDVHSDLDILTLVVLLFCFRLFFLLNFFFLHKLFNYF